MKKFKIIAFAWLASSFGANGQSTETMLLEGWRFHNGAAAGAYASDYDDSKWQSVTIPHDWAISGPFNKNHDIQVVAIEQNGEKDATEKTGRSGALPWIGEGWYRTDITIPEGYTSAELIFDGAMSEPHVYVNGKDVGYWAYGYNTFSLDITDATDGAKAGTYPVAVNLKNVEESSRWYPGAGLYRPVRLVLHPEKYIQTWGTFVRTTAIDGVSDDYTKAKHARMQVTTDIVSSSHKDLTVTQTLKDSYGNVVAKSSSHVNDSHSSENTLVIDNARLWSPEHPVLYTLQTTLSEGDKIWDQSEMKVGIRDISYTHEGFKLNGQLRKFKGVCLHHDLGPLGTAFNKAAFRRQVRLLKDIGCDAIRTSHNTPAPWQMDICDEEGMMVMAESFDMWKYPKCANGYCRFFDVVDETSVNKDGNPWWYRDITNLVLLNRNHPSNVMYSIGNEIPEQGQASGLKYTKQMLELIHNLDGTRPATQGFDRGEAPIHSGVWQAMDVPGFNYRLHVYHKGHENSPTGIVLGSETASTISSRGVYKFPVTEEHGTAYPDGQISSYDLESCIWSNLPDDDWMYQDKLPWVIGEFVWTGFDYLGEPTPYDEYWPSRSSYFGIYDLAGLPKDRAYLYRTHWNTDDATLHVLPHWTWSGREGEVTPVFVYTTYPEAELFVNGKSLGRKKKIEVDMQDYLDNRVQEPMPWGGTSTFADPNTPEGKNRLDRYRLRWMDAVYEPGEITVVAYDADGNVAETKTVRTAGKPHHIELVPDRNVINTTPIDAEGKAIETPDLSFVTVRVVDKDGNLCPHADNQLNFTVTGAGAFNSACNGDATSTEVFVKPTMKAFNGELVVVVEGSKIPGDAVLTVTGKGLKPAKTTIQVAKPVEKDELKPRLVVLTDIGPAELEPDDNESAVRLMAYADRFEIEAICTSTGWNCDPYPESSAEYLFRVIDAYEKDVDNLKKRSGQEGFRSLDEEKGIQELGYWPSAEYIRSRAMFGSKRAGIAVIGEGNDSPGSDFLIQLADEEDPRPIWVTAWGGANTLAQAIWRVQQTRTPEEVDKFIRKFRLYTITDQDMVYDKRKDLAYSSHQWMRREFPDKLKFVWDESAWLNHNALGSQSWDKYAELIQTRGNLGKTYPKYLWGVEGDTPSFLNVMPSGLNDPEDPTQVGWGGYHVFALSLDSITYAWTNWQEPVKTLSDEFEKKFYPDSFNDFAARMVWADSGKGNTNPVVLVNGIGGVAPIYASFNANGELVLDASMSYDSEVDDLTFLWWIQGTEGIRELGTTSRITLTPDDLRNTCNRSVVCEVHDSGPFNLVSYRRIVIR